MLLPPYAIGLIALALLLVSSSHFAAVGWRAARASWRSGGVRLREQSHLRREAQHARLASELSWQTATNSPSAWRVVEVVEIVDESADCRSFYLRDPLGSPLPNFQPGQFVMVRPALGGASQPTRCYSLSDAPGQPWWRITVKRQLPSRSAHARSAAVAREQGSLSVWLHERIGVGDCLLVSGPCGEFVLDDDCAGPIVLLAAGIGITPLVSMLKHALQTNPARPVQVHFQVQDDQHWPLGEVLHSWQAACPALSVTSYFSRQVPHPLPAHGRARAGKVTASNVIEDIGTRAEGAYYYLCGPEAWMDGLISDLGSLGVSCDQIHHESFAAADRPAQGSSAPDEGSASEAWSLRFAASGLDLEPSCEPATIWEAASASGLTLPANCHSGACGACRLRLLAGQVRYRRRPQCHVAEGEVLACIAQPIGEVIVDA